MAVEGEGGKLTTASPVWLGPAHRPLFGRVNIPESGSGRALVILCPSVGMGGLHMQCTYRLLGEQLAEAGFYSLRIDYDGWGDSSGSWDDPDRVETWLSSIEESISWAKTSGATRIFLVGTELGGLLAAATADRIERSGSRLLDGLVLWDTSWSGKSFLREQQVVHQIMVGSPSVVEGSKEGPGFVFDPQTVDSLNAIDFLGFEGTLAQKVLVLARTDRPPRKAVSAKLAKPNIDVDLNVDSHDVIYQDIGGVLRDPVERIVRWLDKLLDADGTFSLEFDSNPTAVVKQLANGDRIIETAVALGEAGMFGIITELESGSEGPPALFLDAGTIDHGGPARLWVDFARLWAESGVRSCRFDFTALGESPRRLGQRFPTIRSPRAFEDLKEAVEAVSPGDPENVIVVGTCSGSYQAIEGALTDNYREIIAINPRLFFGAPELRNGRNDPRRVAQQTNRRWVRALVRPVMVNLLHRRARMLDTAKWPIQIQYSYPWIPEFVWGIINFIFLRNSPGSTFAKLARRGVSLFLIIGEPDMIDLSRGDMGSIRRLGRNGKIIFRLVPGLDHGLHACGPRAEMFDQVTEHVLGVHAKAVADAMMSRSAALELDDRKIVSASDLVAG